MLLNWILSLVKNISKTQSWTLCQLNGNLLKLHVKICIFYLSGHSSKWFQRPFLENKNIDIKNNNPKTKPCKVVTLHICKQEVNMVLKGKNYGVDRTRILSGGCRGEFLPLTFPVARSHPHSLAHGPFTPLSKPASVSQVFTLHLSDLL